MTEGATMPHVYTGTLTDIGLGVLTGRYPVMRVRPEQEAFGPDGLVSAVPEEVALNDATGAFSMTLYASSELSPQVRYVIEVGRFEQGFEGPRFVGIDSWSFFAKPGGGNVSEQGSRSPYAVFFGPPWPTPTASGSPLGLYIDQAPPNAWGIKEA